MVIKMIKNWQLLLLCVIGCIAVGATSGIISGDSMKMYSDLKLPDIYPPGYLFPIVWTILYALMGVSLYLIIKDGIYKNEIPLAIFGIQLVLNFCWLPIFFVMSNYLAAFILLVVIWIFVLMMIYTFWKVDKYAGAIQIPYLIWVTFAGYLSYSVYIIN